MISIANTHRFSKGVNGFQISPLMQETMVYAGQLDSYGQGKEIIEKMTGVSVSNTQQYRVTDSYGKQSEVVVNESRTPSPLQPDNVLYMLGIRSQPFI